MQSDVYEDKYLTGSGIREYVNYRITYVPPEVINERMAVTQSMRPVSKASASLANALFVSAPSSDVCKNTPRSAENLRYDVRTTRKR